MCELAYNLFTVRPANQSGGKAYWLFTKLRQCMVKMMVIKVGKWAERNLKNTCSGVSTKVLFAMVKARFGIVDISWQLTVDSPLGLGRRSHSWNETKIFLSAVTCFSQLLYSRK
jgi:hypothetical protein